ncbi:MAG: hypothetical protein HWE20_03500 [Gammaproteobacteria bacterium]|nr:hypothetical protein [Gammaproteobacteria bacterium]
MDWMKIISAIMIVAMIVYIFPRAKAMMQNSPKAEKGDWNAAALPLVGVVAFVILLIMMARSL